MKHTAKRTRLIRIDDPGVSEGTSRGVPSRSLDAIHRSRGSSPGVGIHSAEITARMFPSRRRGFEREAVMSWLRVVAASYETLEGEVRRLQAGWDDLLFEAARLRRALGDVQAAQIDWVSLAHAAVVARPASGMVAQHATTTREAFRAPPRSRRALRVAVDASMAQLSRLQQSLALVEASNERLRTELIESLVGGRRLS